MFKFFYNILWHLILPVWLIIYFLNHGKSKRYFKDKLSLFRSLKHDKKAVIWFHGSSLGEIITLIPFMETLKKRLDHFQVLSFSTERGEKAAEKSKAEKIMYIPLDMSYFIRLALKRIKPDIVIILETEIWPNLFWECENLKIPVVIISGRISNKSYPKYKLAKAFFKDVLKNGHFLMQTDEDKSRIVDIGAPDKNVFVTGDIKLDGIKMDLEQSEIISLNQTFKLNFPVLVAGSTHNGEEEIIIDAWCSVRKKYPSMSLILAPRHLDRVKSVEEIIIRKGFEYKIGRAHV